MMLLPCLIHRPSNAVHRLSYRVTQNQSRGDPHKR